MMMLVCQLGCFFHGGEHYRTDAEKHLKMRWWCHDYRLYFIAYEYDQEGNDIAANVMQIVEGERERKKR